jgi:hypothetical protein
MTRSASGYMLLASALLTASCNRTGPAAAGRPRVHFVLDESEFDTRAADGAIPPAKIAPREDRKGGKPAIAATTREGAEVADDAENADGGEQDDTGNAAEMDYAIFAEPVLGN